MLVAMLFVESVRFKLVLVVRACMFCATHAQSINERTLAVCSGAGHHYHCAGFLGVGAHRTVDFLRVVLRFSGRRTPKRFQSWWRAQAQCFVARAPQLLCIFRRDVSSVSEREEAVCVLRCHPRNQNQHQNSVDAQGNVVGFRNRLAGFFMLCFVVTVQLWWFIVVIFRLRIWV